jgi:hypothetical protein
VGGHAGPATCRSSMSQAGHGPSQTGHGHGGPVEEPNGRRGEQQGGGRGDRRDRGRGRARWPGRWRVKRGVAEGVAVGEAEGEVRRDGRRGGHCGSGGSGQVGDRVSARDYYFTEFWWLPHFRRLKKETQKNMPLLSAACTWLTKIKPLSAVPKPLKVLLAAEHHAIFCSGHSFVAIFLEHHTLYIPHEKKTVDEVGTKHPSNG